MAAVQVAYKPPALKSLETLSDTHRAWLEHLYDDSHDPRVTARAFGVSPQAVIYVRESPAGQAYALKKIGGDRSAMNLFAAKQILERMQTQRGLVPLDILLKIYSATLPKDPPQGKTDDMLDYAERLANSMDLDEEERAALREFVLTGGEA
jgi:hypothetical protein